MISRLLREHGFPVLANTDSAFTYETVQENILDIQNLCGSKVQEFYVTFPILRYLTENLSDLSNKTYRLLQPHGISLFLNCLIHKDTTWVKKAFPSLACVRSEQEIYSFCEEAQRVLHGDEISNQEIVQECNNLLSLFRVTKSTKSVPVAVPDGSQDPGEESPEVENEIENEIENETDAAVSTPLPVPPIELRQFRTVCQGRSWVDDSIYHVFFLIRHNVGAKGLWKNMPKCFVRHKNKTVLSSLQEEVHPPSTAAWCHALNAIKYVEHPAVTLFHETSGVTGEPTKKTLQQMFTVAQPKWKEYWTFMGWSCRRNVRRKIERLAEKEMDADFLQQVALAHWS
jgi:hypothetical protein